VTGCVVRSATTISSLIGEVPKPSVSLGSMLKLCQSVAPRAPPVDQRVGCHVNFSAFEPRRRRQATRSCRSASRKA
jgi:hypothetical protein